MSLRDEENMDDLDQIDTVYLSFSYNLIRLDLNFPLLQIKRVNVKLHLKD